MFAENTIREPFRFNPLKHHLEYIRGFVNGMIPDHSCGIKTDLAPRLRHIGGSVMDVYYGSLTVEEICSEIHEFLVAGNHSTRDDFAGWAGSLRDSFRLMTLSDESVWTLKYHSDERRFVHIFPSRMSPLTFRVKANTLRSAIVYFIYIGKDFITADDLNKARELTGLSPVRDAADARAITEMIEMIRHGM
ncbi:MAG: hypothetical protein RBU28_04680 [Bacteroidales bacterium]|jgi:hypothetical protein|nr:hypothetical protein [Bacteroidales bacterium]